MLESCLTNPSHSLNKLLAQRRTYIEVQILKLVSGTLYPIVVSMIVVALVQHEMKTLVRNTHKDIIPIKVPVHKEKARAITEEERKYSAFVALRQARAHARLAGKRAVKQKEAEQEKK